MISELFIRCFKYDTFSVFGKTSGRANNENKYELPPPADNKPFSDPLHRVWGIQKILMLKNGIEYTKFFGGFEDIGDDDSTMSEDSTYHPDEEYTKNGYIKDGFVVDDSDSTDDDSLDSENMLYSTNKYSSYTKSFDSEESERINKRIKELLIKCGLIQCTNVDVNNFIATTVTKNK